ncbi:MAG: polysaccharide deacetylase family protein, partial [Gammaproteobacteria bacterium]|nr:polysaccharide deacetylase family protein [Gammaproteobacteria bacterium]
MFTVDVESIPLKNGTKDYSSVIDGIPLLLDLFKEFDISSTFFLTSDVAENTACTIKEVIKRGHEIACHGAEHQLLDLNDR